MRVQIVGSGSAVGGFALSTFLVDGVLALDAGALGWFDTPTRQAEIRHVLLTHAHLDHVAGLGSFLENVYGLSSIAPTILAPQPVLSALQMHIFNDVILPDFVRLSTPPAKPFLQLRTLTSGVPDQVGNYQVTPFEVIHTVPCYGYVVDDGLKAMAVVTDTGPVPAVMAGLAQVPRLSLVLLEASFPNRLASLARLTKHLEVDQFLAMARLLPPSVTICAVHIKPQYEESIEAELRVVHDNRIRIVRPGDIVEC